MDQVVLRLGPKQRALYERLQGCGDVSIDELFEAVGGKDGRHRQSWLGPYITRLNRRLAPHHLAVRPGDLKRTYRLQVV